jgi:hypothetical protein
MRSEDFGRLNQLYPENVEPTDADARAAVGINLPRWIVLEDGKRQTNCIFPGSTRV